jgi:hypothetical protein
MPLKDPIANAAYRRAFYIANKVRIGVATAAYRTKKADEKKAALALVPKVVEPRICQGCGANAAHSAFPSRGRQCKVCVSAYNKTYRASNGSRISASKKQWAVDNADYKAEQDRKYAQLHPDKRARARGKWDAANPGKSSAAKKLNATARKKRAPAWLTDDDKWMLDQAYELAALRTRLFGFSWHVDHVIPLNGRKVSGLHVPTNLRVIPGAENLRKSNRFEVQHGE